jgi:hypothetical protein
VGQHALGGPGAHHPAQREKPRAGVVDALAGVGRQECQVGGDEGSLLLANVPRVRLSARDADMLPLPSMGVHNTL